ncbi:enolase-phosphatase E1 isoform X2 [Anabas testudineus]|uniref:enolase-phosphatase E1 isoform X2 n=1 Tax=Anabas testudineus TaxID=64144 RepID=UPI000E46023C|nr:enolase-phosphatase E1 isoform X2 [Anabas testudineus]
MGTQGTGRKRSTKKERTTAEDSALDLIAREAEARLAAKRAARAEAREIRMKELERQQKELSDDDERMSVGSHGSVRGSSSHKKSKKKKKHKHKDRNCSRLSDESRASRSSRVNLTSSGLSDDSRVSRASRLDLQPAAYASSDLYSLNGLSSSRNPGSALNGYQSSLYEDSLCSGSRQVIGSSSHPLDYTSYRGSSSRASSRASSARASPVVEDCLEKGSRAASALTAATLTSLGGTSSRRGSGETAITVDAETSIREIKDALAELEEKYRKAMVSNAQLDNEKSNLMYQVDTLKDSLVELEEQLSESRREFEEKVKEYEREKHAHSVLQFQFNEMKDTLKQSEELLNKHGIVLGPDLNINGDVGEAEVDGVPSGDSAPHPATQDSQTSPVEGSSVLGNTEESQLRSSEEEELEPEQHQEMLKEESKENNLSFDTLCNVADVATLKTSSEEEPTEEQQTCSPTEEDDIEGVLSKDMNVNDHPITEAKDIKICSPELEEILSPTRNVVEQGIPDGQYLEELSNPVIEQTETKNGSVDTHSCDNTETSKKFFEEQENTQEAVKESNLNNTELSQKQNIENIVKENLPDDTTPAASYIEPQQELENAEEENDETEELCSKSQPQGATASGKKKKRKRRTRKKGGTHEDKNQQKDGKKENSKTETDVKLAKGDDRSTTECNIHSSTTEAFRELKLDQVKNEQDSQDIAETNEPRMDQVTNEQTEQSLETESFVHIEISQERRTDPTKDELNKEEPLETEKLEKVDSVTSHTEANHGTFDLVDSSASEPLTELTMDQVRNEQDRQEAKGVDAAETVELTESFSHKAQLNEPRMDHVTNEQTEQSLETETVEVVASSESLVHIETPQETRTDPTKDEQDKEHPLVTEKAETMDSGTSTTEASHSTSDLIDTTNSTESTGGLEKTCTSSLDSSKSGEQSNNLEVIHGGSDIFHVEDKVGSVDKIEPVCTMNNPESSLETNSRENTEAESHVPCNSGIAAEEFESIDSSQMFSLKRFSDKEQLPQSSTAIEVSAREPEEVDETVKEPGIETDQEFYLPSHDGSSELQQDTAEKEKLAGSVRESVELVEICSSPDVEKSYDGALTKNTDLDNEESVLETAAQAELNEIESQTLECVDHTDKTNVEVSLKTETLSNTTDSPNESTEIYTPIEQASTVAEDSRHEHCKNHQESDTCVQPLDEQLHKTSKDEPESDDSSGPKEQECDEDDCVDEEGQSFDFDDMDVEAAIATNLSTNPEQEEAEDAVEVMSDESNSGSPVQCQSNSEADFKTQEKPAENSEEKCIAEESNQGGTLEKESDTLSQDNKSSLAHEGTPEKEPNVCEEVKTQVDKTDVVDEGRHIAEEGKVTAVGELGAVAEKIEHETAIEEGLDAIKHEMQDEGLVLLKSEDQVARSNEPPQSGKDGKKNGKKGKGKSKEECKMS